MTDITFSRDEKQLLVDKIRRYFEQELNQELGQFDAEFLLDFLSRELGPHYYNRGLLDAQAILQSRLDTILEGIDELTRITG